MVNLSGSDYLKEFTKENYIITRYGLFMIMVNGSLKVERETTIVYGWYAPVSGIGRNVVRREKTNSPVNSYSTGNVLLSRFVCKSFN